jgi:predicted Zn-dependent peptidase
MKRFVFIFGVIALMMATSTVAFAAKYKYETVKGDPLKTRIYTLDNGLKIYLNVNRETPRVQTYIAVRVGAKNDPAETTGLAHYFEHLMFKGSQQFGTKDYAAEKPLLDQVEALFEVYRKTTDEAERAELYRRIDSISYISSGYAIPNEYAKLMMTIGATGTNAYTAYDQTVYVEDIPANQMENWLKIEADRFKFPVLRGFHTELETIYEEKNMSLTQDGRKSMEQILAGLFPTHPYGTQTILGTQEQLKNPSITNVKNYHAEWYVPNNMAICLSGDLNPDTTVALIDKYFGDMKPNSNLPKLNFEPLPEITSPITKEVMGLDAENVAVAWRTGGAGSTDADFMNIISRILYNGQAGLVDLDLNQGQKVLGAYAYFQDFVDYGFLAMGGRPQPGQTLDGVKDLLLAEIAKLRAGEFDERVLQAIIDNYKVERMHYLDSNDGRADAYVSAFINGVEWKSAVEQLDRISKITKEDVMAFATKNFTDQNYVVVYKREGKDTNVLTMSKPTLTPLQTNRDATSKFVSDIAASTVAPIEPVFVDFNRDMSRLKAKSDIEVLYKKNETTDIFTLMYLYEVGSNNDPSINIASAYLEYLGTDNMSAQQLAQEFYNIACSFNVVAGEDRTYVTISGLSENMPRAMQLTESLLNGAVADEAVLAMLKSDMQKARDDAKLNQGRNFGSLQTYASRGPEFIKNNTLSNDALNALTSEELLGKIRAFAGQQHRILYYGPKKQKELLVDISKNHNVAAKLSPVAEKVKFPYVETSESGVLLAEYDAAQIYFLQYSNRGEKYDSKLDAISTLYNTYFGGGMNGIVFQEMREARGLAYASQATLIRPRKLEDPYTYIAFIATQNDKLKDATTAFDEIINEMPESDAAFEVAKESIITNIRTDRIIKDDVLWYWISAQDLGMDYDRRRPVYEQVPAMTLGDVKAFQQKWVKGRPYTFSILGRSADLDTEFLNSLGPVKKVSKEDIFGY